MIDGPIPRQPAPPAAPVRPRVLLADDDDSLRRTIAALLGDRGCEVVSARDGVEATRLATRAGARFDALVTDVVMPGATGIEVAAAFLGAHPGARAILMSGSLALEVDDDPRLAGRAVFLAKPFGAATLLERLHEVLGGTAARTAPWVRRRAA